MQVFNLVCILIFISSCQQNPNTGKTVFVSDTTHVQGTDIFVKESSPAGTFADSLPSGAYQGMYPCKGCEGIQQTILFTDDKKYRLEEVSWGKTGVAKKTEGIWERKNGLIWLYQPGRIPLRFFLKKDSLFTDSLQYALGKKQLASTNTAWNRMANDGIDFLAIGNEPFWNAEIDNEKQIKFRLADWSKPVIYQIQQPVVSKDSTVYKLSPDENPLTITILSEFCSDGMSDFLYQNKVIVKYKGMTYTGCGIKLAK